MAKASRDFRKRFRLPSIPGAVQSDFPGFIVPAQPVMQSKVPIGDRWQFEIKYDGYRTLLLWHRGEARAIGRKRTDFTKHFPSICKAAKELPAESAILDGEVIVQDARGNADFQGMRRAIARDEHRLLFYAFDLLYLEGFDLRGAVLTDRRRLLAELVAGQPGNRILMSETWEGTGTDLLRMACQNGIEGVVAKRKDSPYRSGDVTTWVKVKCTKTMELPVIGYVPAKGGSIAALRLGRPDDRGALIYAGKVGTGFSVRTAQTVRQRLEPLMRKTPPLAKPLRKKDTVWVEPKLKARVTMMDLTDDGQIRHGSFKGIA